VKKLVLAALLLILTSQVEAATSTFDTDLDGWTYTNLNPSNDSPASLTWESTGGNPGGFVKFTDLKGDHAAIAAPNKFLGDWSNAVSIEYDMKIIEDGNNPTFLPFEVMLFNENAGISAEWNGSKPTSTTDWQHTTVMLNDPRWVVTGGSWIDLLANITDFYITIEVVQDLHNDVEGIDNVGVSAVPIPAAVWLFGSGLLGLLGYSRKKAA